MTGDVNTMNQEATDLLFDAPEQPSPRLAWMRKYHVKTALGKDEDGDDEWAAASDLLTSDRRWGFGRTEQDAIADLALKRGWKLWNEEEAL